MVVVALLVIVVFIKVVMELYNGANSSFYGLTAYGVGGVGGVGGY